jgi:hypothetical protein
LCGYAADAMGKAREGLEQVSLEPKIFGDFAGATGFHAKLSEAHQRHQERLGVHRGTLRSLSEKAAKAAGAFVDADESGADGIGAAGGAFG